MINYLSYIAIAYEHLCPYALSESSNLTNDGHCGHRLGEHGGDPHGHGRPLFLAAGWYCN